MPTRRTAFIAIVLFSIVAALLTWRHRARVPIKPVAQAAAMNTPNPAASIAPKRSSDKVSSGRPKPEIPDDRPFADIRPELERRALAGDAIAARRLGMALANCNHYVDLPEDKLENMIVEGAAKGFTVRDNGRVVPPDELLRRSKLSLEQKRRDCKGVSGLDESDAFGKAFQWIERAAALGDADAEAVYGSLAFTGIDDRNALVEAETLRDRRRLAIDYLQHSLAQGDALALLRMSGQYDGGYLYPPNAEMAYTYLYAYSLTARADEIVPELLDQALSERAAPLDEAARERARAEGQRIAACCGVVGEVSP